MKTKLLYPLIALLIISNVVLLYLLFNKPNEHALEAKNFLIEKLKLSKEQEAEFVKLDKEHHTIMMGYDKTIIDFKKELLNAVSNNEKADMSISYKIGLFEGKKEEEIFSFFSEVRKLCKQEQKEILDEVLKQVILSMHPPRGPRPPKGENHPPPPNH